MVQIPEITITDDNGFFADKNFVWENIQPFSIITGTNGSGKTKLLEFFDGKLRYDLNHLITYISVDYKPPHEKYANEIAEKYTYRMKNIDGKFFATNKHDNIDADWSHQKKFFKNNGILRELDYSIIDSIIQEYKKFRQNVSSCRIELDRIERYQEIFDITYLLPVNKEDDQPWDRIDRILKDFGLSIRVDRVNLNAELGFLRFNSATSSETLIEMKDLSSGEKVAFALALWTWGNSTNQKTEVLLVDEFDAHLNPSIAKKFIAIIREYFVDLGVQVIMTTHNPSTVAFAKNLGADIVWMEDGKIDKDMTYDDIIHILSNGLLDINKLEQDAQLLVNNNKRIVVFTEGKYDKKYIETAIRVLQMDQQFDDVYIFASTGAETIPAFVKIPFGHQISIALFDTDTKGKEIAEQIQTDLDLQSRIAQQKVIVMHISSEDNKAIEDLFAPKLRSNKSKDGFAKLMSKRENQTEANFTNFKLLLDNIINHIPQVNTSLPP